MLFRKKYLHHLITVILLLVILFGLYAWIFQKPKPVITLFPIEHYDQSFSDWINLADPRNDQSLLTPDVQQQHMRDLFDREFGEKSPWNSKRLQHLLNAHPSDIANEQAHILAFFESTDPAIHPIAYGENFRPYAPDWIQNIATNMSLPSMAHLSYSPAERFIATSNLNARALPTDDVYFYDRHIAGQGYPFDNLSVSAVWAGTPLYRLGETHDHAWSLVLTPDFTAWVKSSGISRVNPAFIQTWTQQAQQQLVAVTRTQLPILDTENHVYRFDAYIGMVFPEGSPLPFPAIPLREADIQILIPIRAADGSAVIHHADLTADEAALMPLLATPQNFITLMQQLIHRPYGWGNAYFYNDCSAELKNLFVPFGIWIPRNSAAQVNSHLFSAHFEDWSNQPMKERLQLLASQGHPWMTIVYIGGHVFLYLGVYPNPDDPEHKPVILTYQNIWGFKEHHRNQRVVVGESVLLPLLARYPENSNIWSLADKPYFKIVELDQVSAS